MFRRAIHRPIQHVSEPIVCDGKVVLITPSPSTMSVSHIIAEIHGIEATMRYLRDFLFFGSEQKIDGQVKVLELYTKRIDRLKNELQWRYTPALEHRCLTYVITRDQRRYETLEDICCAIACVRQLYGKHLQATARRSDQPNVISITEAFRAKLLALMERRDTVRRIRIKSSRLYICQGPDLEQVRSDILATLNRTDIMTGEPGPDSDRPELGPAGGSLDLQWAEPGGF